MPEHPCPGLWSDPSAVPSLLTALREATAACAAASASSPGPPLAPLQRALRLASQLLQYADGRPQAPNLQRAVVELAQVGRDLPWGRLRDQTYRYSLLA